MKRFFCTMISILLLLFLMLYPEEALLCAQKGMQLWLNILIPTLEDAGGKYKTFIDSLQSCLEVVNHNRQELAPQTAQAAAITGSYHEEPAREAEDDGSLLDDLGDE